MARLARRLRDAILPVCAAGQSPSSAPPDQTADQVAQAVVYGLFAARCTAASCGFSDDLARTALLQPGPFLPACWNALLGREPCAQLIAQWIALLQDAEVDPVL